VAAHSYIRLGAQFLFSWRESYSDEFAAMFRDEELTTTLDAPVYALKVWQLRERLDILGFTSAAAGRRLAAHYEDALTQEPNLEVFADWLAENAASFGDEDLMSGEVPEWTVWGDPRLPLRLMLDVAPDDSTVALDLSDVVSRGYVQGTPDLCARAFEKQHGEWMNAPLIVLTEGITDAEFLGLALQVLAPHLLGFVRFLNYEFKPEGGTSALVRAVRAFAAAGVSNRVIALFDNDSAAAEALLTLDVKALPPNFRVVKLPELPLAEDYPTLGPSGPSRMNINGLATSLELFFGEDVLVRGGGELPPVQWRGYMSKVGRYQGEVMEKAALQQVFRERAQQSVARGTPGTGEDWSGMQALLDVIRAAFN
jgi:hypothetical protein